jgi:transcriptional regulator with XRE-family HTH domain
LGVTPGYVSDVELGRRMPSEALLRRLAGLLGLELGELLERAGRLDTSTEEYLRRTPEAVRLVRKLAALRLRGPELLELGRVAEELRRRRSKGAG